MNTFRTHFRAATVFGATLLASASFANLLQNGSFENGDYGGQNWSQYGFELVNAGDSTTITGWTVFNPGTDLAVFKNGNYAGFVAEDGNISLDLTGEDAFGGPYGGVEQAIATVPGNVYSLSFYIGIDNGGNGQYSGPASVDAIINGVSTEFTNSNQGNSMQWARESEEFTATGTSTNIQLLGEVASTGNGPYIGLDNVDVEAVPEPVSAGALGLGFAAFLLRRRAKSRIS